MGSEVAEEGPGGQDDEKDPDEGGGGESGAQAGPTLVLPFHEKHQRYERHEEEQHGVIVPRGGYIAVKQSMKGPLRAASGALQSCKHQKTATGKKSRFGVDKSV